MGIIKVISSKEDLPLCLDVIHASYLDRDKKLGISDNSHLHSSLSLDELISMFNEGIKMYGYYLDDVLVAFLSFKEREDEVKIKDIVVLPNYQNNGIGKIMIDYVKNYANKVNKKIVLKMIYENESLRKWYEKNGFKLKEIIDYPTSKVGRMEFERSDINDCK